MALGLKRISRLPRLGLTRPTGGGGVVVPGVAPTISGATITGTVQDGFTLTAVPGTVTGNPTPTPTYQWRSWTASSGGTSTNLGAASTQALSSQVGKFIDVVVTETNTAGAASATSARTAAVAAAGSALAAPTLAMTTSGPSPQFLITGLTAANVAAGYVLRMEWALDGNNFSPLVSSSERTIDSFDMADPENITWTGVGGGVPLVDGNYDFRLNYRNPGVATSAYSNVIDNLVVAGGAAPTIASASIAGTPQSGLSLTAVANTVTGNPTPTPSYQWRAWTASSGGASTNLGTGSTQSMTATEVGKFIDVVITETNVLGSDTKTSARTSAVAAAGSSVFDLDFSGLSSLPAGVHAYQLGGGGTAIHDELLSFGGGKIIMTNAVGNSYPQLEVTVTGLTAGAVHTITVYNYEVPSGTGDYVRPGVEAWSGPAGTGTRSLDWVGASQFPSTSGAAHSVTWTPGATTEYVGLIMPGVGVDQIKTSRIRVTKP